MKSALFAAVLLAFPLCAAAGGKYVVRNGRAVVGGGAGPSGGAAVAASAPRADAGRSSGAGPLNAGGGQAFISGGAHRASGGHRSFYGGVRRLSHRAYRVPQRALDDDGSGDAPVEPEPPSTEEAPPHFSKPGALIRTEGHRRFEYAEAAEPSQRHELAAGAIALNENRAYHVNRSHGLRMGPADTLPGRKPGRSGGGDTGITPNSDFDPSF